METSQPWVTCFLTDILLTYLDAHPSSRLRIDYPALFRGNDGPAPPPDASTFLRHSHNWVPLAVLRELLSQCEQVTGRKEVAYLAARDYFTHRRDDLLTLFEIIFRVLNDVRSVVRCSHLLAAAHTNYLRLQSFETPSPDGNLYMLAQFNEQTPPTIGSMHFVRGLAEGFPRLYSFIEDIRCIEEISQLRLEDIVREFPAYRMSTRGDRLFIRAASAAAPIVEARRIVLKSETIALAQGIPTDLPDAIVSAHNGTIRVLTNQEETARKECASTHTAYRVEKSGAIGKDEMRHVFTEGQVYDAPYSRLRFTWSETPRNEGEPPVAHLRRQFSDLLVEYMKQTRHMQTRMAAFNIEHSRLIQENSRLRREIEGESGFSGMIGRSKAMLELFAVIRSLAATDVSVLIQGETGTGKELCARAIHFNSPRRAQPFVAVNCGALAETLLQSELFGHEKGAFTGADARRRGIFEAADGGTLFLDEIGEISPGTQVKLLRVLQDGEFQRVGGTETIHVDVRLLSATNQDLQELVRTGRFRQDLYYRLNVFPVRVPPLRERPDDIPLLTEHFIEAAKRKMRKTVRRVHPEVMSLLVAHQWPGNVRELENVIQRMMVVAQHDSLNTQDAPPELRTDHAAPADNSKHLHRVAKASTALAEKQAIIEALNVTKRNVTRAAKLLGISRATLQNKMKAYDLRKPEKGRTA